MEAPPLRREFSAGHSFHHFEKSLKTLVSQMFVQFPGTCVERSKYMQNNYKYPVHTVDIMLISEWEKDHFHFAIRNVRRCEHCRTISEHWMCQVQNLRVCWFPRCMSHRWSRAKWCHIGQVILPPKNSCVYRKFSLSQGNSAWWIIMILFFSHPGMPTVDRTCW